MNINQHFSNLAAKAAEEGADASQLISQRERLFKDKVIPELTKRGANNTAIIQAREKWYSQTDKVMQSAGLLPKAGQNSRSFAKDKRADKAVQEAAKTGSKLPIIKETIKSTGETIGNLFGQGVGSTIEGAAGFVRDIGENEKNSTSAKLANYGKNLRKEYEGSASSFQKGLQAGDHGKVAQLSTGAIQSVPAMIAPFGAAKGVVATAGKIPALKKVAPYLGLGAGVVTGHTQNYGEVRRNATENLARDFPSWEKLQGNPLFEKNFQDKLNSGLSINKARQEAHAQTLDTLSEQAANKYGTAMTAIDFIAPSGAVLGSGILKNAPTSSIGKKLVGGGVDSTLVKRELQQVPRTGMAKLVPDVSIAANKAAMKMVGKQALEEGLQGGIGEYGAQAASANIGGTPVDYGKVGQTVLEEGLIGGIMGGGMQSATGGSPTSQAKEAAKQLRNQTNTLRQEEAAARKELADAMQLNDPAALQSAQDNLNNIGAEATKVKAAYDQYGIDTPYFVQRFAAQYQPQQQQAAQQGPAAQPQPTSQPQPAPQAAAQPQPTPAAPFNQGMANTTNLVMDSISNGFITPEEAQAIQTDPIRADVFTLTMTGDVAAAHNVVMNAVSLGNIDTDQAQELIQSITRYSQVKAPKKPSVSSIVNNHVKQQIHPQDRGLFSNPAELDPNTFEPIDPNQPSPFQEDFNEPKAFSNPTKANDYVRINGLAESHDIEIADDGTLVVVKKQGIIPDDPNLNSFGYSLENIVQPTPADPNLSNFSEGPVSVDSLNPENVPDVLDPKEPQQPVQPTPTKQPDHNKPKTFTNYVRASDFVKTNGLKDSHEIIKKGEGQVIVQPKSITQADDPESDQAFDDMLNAVPPIGTPITKPPTAPKQEFQDRELSNAEQITRIFSTIGNAFASAAIGEVAGKLAQGKRVQYFKTASIEAAKKNPNYHLADNEDGSVDVIGVRDDNGVWHGQAPENTETKTEQPAPSGNLSFADKFRDAHLNNPSIKPRLINDEIDSGRSRADVLKEATEIVKAINGSKPKEPLAQPERTDGTTEVLEKGITIVHGSGNSELKAENIQIIRADGQKQGKKGRVYGGFYGTSEADANQAEGYAGMMGGTPTLYDVKIKPNTKVLNKSGDVTRLSENYINELTSQGYGVVVGKDPRGRTEYVVIDSNAIESVNPRSKGKEAPKEQLSLADQIAKGFSDIASGVSDAAIQQVAGKIEKGEEVKFSKPDSIKSAQSNPNYNVRKNNDGSVSVIGVKKPSGEWVGINPEAKTVNDQKTGDNIERIGPAEPQQDTPIWKTAKYSELPNPFNENELKVRVRELNKVHKTSDSFNKTVESDFSNLYARGKELAKSANLSSAGRRGNTRFTSLSFKSDDTYKSGDSWSTKPTESEILQQAIWHLADQDKNNTPVSSQPEQKTDENGIQENDAPEGMKSGDIGRGSDGKPFLSKNAANRGLKLRDVESTHEVVEISPSNFVLRETELTKTKDNDVAVKEELKKLGWIGDEGNYWHKKDLGSWQGNISFIQAKGEYQLTIPHSIYRNVPNAGNHLIKQNSGESNADFAKRITNEGIQLNRNVTMIEAAKSEKIVKEMKKQQNSQKDQTTGDSAVSETPAPQKMKKGDIGRKSDNQPFASATAAKTTIKKQGLDNSHEVVQLAPSSFVLRQKDQAEPLNRSLVEKYGENNIIRDGNAFTVKGDPEAIITIEGEKAVLSMDGETLRSGYDLTDADKTVNYFSDFIQSSRSRNALRSAQKTAEEAEKLNAVKPKLEVEKKPDNSLGIDELKRLQMEVEALLKNPKPAEDPATKTNAEPVEAEKQTDHPYQKYDDLAKQYGRSVRPDGAILKGNGQDTNVRISEKKGRLRIEDTTGKTLFTGATNPESLGKFLEDYWYDTKSKQKPKPEPTTQEEPKQAPPADDIGRASDNAPFANEGAANIALRKKGLEDTHAVVRIAPSQFVLRDKSQVQHTSTTIDLSDPVKLVESLIADGRKVFDSGEPIKQGHEVTFTYKEKAAYGYARLGIDLQKNDINEIITNLDRRIVMSDPYFSGGSKNLGSNVSFKYKYGLRNGGVKKLVISPMKNGDVKITATVDSDSKKMTRLKLVEETQEALKAQEPQAAPIQPEQNQEKAKDPLAFPIDKVKEAYGHAHLSPGNTARAFKESFDKFIQAEIDDAQALATTEAQQTALDEAIDWVKTQYINEALPPLLNAASATVSSARAGRNNFNSKQADQRGSALDKATAKFDAELERLKGYAKLKVLAARTPKQKQADAEAEAQAQAEKDAAEQAKVEAQIKADAEAKANKKRASNEWITHPDSAEHMTMEEWKAIGKDYKGITDGVRRHMGVPVWITDEGKSKPKNQSNDVLKVGDTITFSEVFDYALPNEPYTIVTAAKAKITLQSESGGQFSFNPNILAIEKAKNPDLYKIDSEKTEPEQPAQPTEKPQANNYETVRKQFDAVTERLDDGDESLTLDEVKAAYKALMDNQESLVSEFSSQTKQQLLDKMHPYYAAMYKSHKKDELVSKWVSNTFRAMDFASGGVVTISYGDKRTMPEIVRNKIEAATQEDLNKYLEEQRQAKIQREKDLEAAEAGMNDPKTMDDFKRIYANGDFKDFKDFYRSLTIPQQALYDELKSDAYNEQRMQEIERNKAYREASNPSHAVESTTEATLFAGKHTKKGTDIWTVALNGRVDGDAFNDYRSQAKGLGGYYSSYKGGGAVPGFIFDNEATANEFLNLVTGDHEAKSTDPEPEAIAVDPQAEVEVIETDAKRQADKLREKAQAVIDRGEQNINRDRKTNTAKRAGDAARAEERANSAIFLGETLNQIADGIENGSVKYLSRLGAMTQLSHLESLLQRASYDQQRETNAKEREITATTITYVEFPQYKTWIDSFNNIRSDLKAANPRLAEKLEKTIGIRYHNAYTRWLNETNEFGTENYVGQLARKSDGSPAVFKTNIKQAETLVKASNKRAGKDSFEVFKIKNGEYAVISSHEAAMENESWKPTNSDKQMTLTNEFGSELYNALKQYKRKNPSYHMNWLIESMHDSVSRMEKLGIHDPATFRAAMREYLSLRSKEKANDPIKEMERSMIGRSNDGLDFFPTPRNVVEQMIEMADLDSDMKVLEPSAGMGHIADVLKDHGIKPDVIELSGKRQDLLKLKGYSVVGNDFLMFDPKNRAPNYGDVFKTADGKYQGVMRGSGSLGSNRVRLMREDDGQMITYFDRDELELVKMNGVNYDRIIMNPPFSDRRDAAHIYHAFDLLADDGVMVAIAGEGVFFGKDKAAKEFQDWLDQVGAEITPLDAGTFNDPSLPVTTGVKARIIKINKADSSGKRFSRSEDLNQVPAHVKENTSGSTPDQIRTELVSRFGEDTIQQLEQKGILSIVPTHTEQGVEGFAENGRVTLVADAITPENIVPVFLHELGGHVGMQGVMKQEAYAVLMKEFNRLVKAGDPAALEAKRLAERETDADVQADEYLPYLITVAARNQAKQGPVQKLISRVLGAVKAWAVDKLGLNLKLNSNDMVALAERMIKTVAKNPTPTGGKKSTGKALNKNSSIARPDYNFSIASLWTSLAKDNDAFEKPISTEKDLKAISLELSDRFTIEEFTPKNQSQTQAWVLTNEDGRTVKVFRSKEEVWVDISNFDTGSGGKDIYNIVANYAYSNNLKFTGDPNGLSGRGMTRRLENMLTSAVKFGTTRHLKPHPKQIEGNDLVIGMNWIDGDDINNLEQLMFASYNTIKTNYPEIESIRYNPEKDIFEGIPTGRLANKTSKSVKQEFTRSDIALLARRARSSPIKLSAEFTPTAGVTTLERAILIHSYLTGTAKNRLDIKERLSTLGSNRLTGSNAILFSRKDSSPSRRYSRSSTANPQNMSRSKQRELLDKAASTAFGQLSLRGAEASKTLSNRTLNLFQTMLHKSLRDETGQFKKTFDLVQGKINHVTFASSKSMDVAPSILTRLEEGSDYWKEVKRVGRTIGHTFSGGKIDKAKVDKDLDKVGKLMFENTLLDNSERHTVKELKQLGFDDDQIGLYNEIRDAIDTSLDTFANTTFSNIYKHLGGTNEEVLELAGKDLDIVDHYNEILKRIDALTKGKPEKADARQAAIEAVDRVFKKANDLKDQGYVPLMRFGKYFVRIWNPTTGEVSYRQHFESESERNIYFRDKEKKGNLPPGTVLEKGQINELQHKLFQGVSPETVALFAKESGLPIGDAETAYIKYAVQNNHALKRLLKRQGIDGFDTDVKRVLASFVMSNARYSANQSYNPAIDESITNIEDPAFQEDAIRLRDYSLDTREELAAVKNFAFVWYMGFSAMFGVVNLTQPLLQTLPYLMQYSKDHGTILKAFGKAVSTWRKGTDAMDPKYKAHYERARKEGHLDPQNTWMMQGLERGKSGLGASTWQLVSHASGLFAQASETVNRRTSLFAALDVAESLGQTKLEQLGFKDAYDFAVRTIQETQGIYNKGNRPRVSRGNVGSVLMMYKQFMIAYIEQMVRMQKSGLYGGEDDEFKKKMAALVGFGVSRSVLTMLGILMALSGTTGLPFVRDILDGIETAGGLVGKPVNTEREIQIALHDALGQTMGSAVNTALMDGIVNLNPLIDVKGRMGMGDLIPATAYFSPTTSDYMKSSEISQIAGPIGGLLEKVKESVALAQVGAYYQAGTQLLPKAGTSLFQGFDAATTGDYRNMKTGVKTNDATVLDGIVKMLDAQPAGIAKEGRIRGLEMKDKSSQTYLNKRWKERYEAALESGDRTQVRDIKQQIRDYNKENPRYPIKFNQKLAETNFNKSNQTWQEKRKTVKGLEWMSEYNPYLDQ